MRITDLRVAGTGTDRRIAAIETALALPGLLLLGIALLVFVAALAGAGPLWPDERLTVSEAAAMHDDADLLRLIGEGADLNGPAPVRGDLLTHDPITLTPLEAVVGAREAQTLKLLLERGARLDDSNWVRLVCFAQRLETEEVVSMLRQRFPDRPAPGCAGVAIPFEP